MLNLLGITGIRAMDQAETDALVRAQVRYSSELTAETVVTADLLRQMHREWLGGIYSWAGQYRTVNVSKDDFAWPPAMFIAQSMTTLETGLLRQHTPCRPADLQTVSHALAEVHAELLFIHPFREGNGRLARWLAEVMTLQAGFPLPNYAFTGRGAKANRAAYIQAMRDGYSRRYDPLISFFSAAITRSLKSEKKL